jgi:hypothetical protein
MVSGAVKIDTRRVKVHNDVARDPNAWGRFQGCFLSRRGMFAMSQPMNPNDRPEPPRPGMSGATKVLLGLGVGCGLIVLLCCGVFGAGTFFVAQMAQQALSNDPDKVHDLTAEIVTIQIPDTLKPLGSLDLNIPIVNTRLMTGVAYRDASQYNVLMLGQFGEQFADDETMQLHWKQFSHESGRHADDVRIEESEKYDTQVNGQPANFTIGKGRDRKAEREVWEVAGKFRGHGGPAVLILRLNASDFSKEQVLDVLKSMQ